MKKYIYYLVLFPILVFAKPPVHTNTNANKYNLGLQVNYPDVTINLVTSDLINTGSGGGSGTLSIRNNILSLYISGSWSAQQMKVGNIKNLNVSPALPNMDLGPITYMSNGVPNGFYAKIENNFLVFYSPFYLSGANANLSASTTGGVSGYSVALPNPYTCNPAGGGGAGGTVSINNGVVNLNFSGGWSSTCNLKTGQIVYLSTSTIANVELGIIKEGTRDTNYRAKIENNFLVFYMVGSPPALPTSGYMNVSKDLNDSSILPVPLDKNYHWIHAVSYDSKGNVTGASRSYFDDLGKSDVSLSKDYVTNKIWGTETTFDSFGRPDKSSFIAPSDLSTFDKTQFFKTPAEILASALPVDQPVGAVTTSQTVKASNTITATAPISSGLNVNFIAGNTIVLGNGFSVTAVAGSSFSATIVVAPDASANAKLSNYYSDNNTLEPYQATATQPYSQNNYDTLNPGNVINVVGGNKINGEWKTGYSYTVPAAQEMYYVYGADYYEGPITSGREEVITKFYKSVSVDANGVENVAFSDGEGKVLASARSGGTISYPVVSLIGTQGFVDVHIPAGITSGISLIGGASLYTVYNLRTGVVTSTLTGGNAYRIQANTAPTTDPKTYILNGAPTYDDGALGIVYAVNYYDYAVNVYNKTGQLIKSIQPNGYEFNSTIKTIVPPSHMTSPNFATTYAYNTLGQVVQTTSADAGTSKFAYRQDGQIRYSQSALQNDTKVSYTDYDTYGRPVESGVIATTWATASANPDAPLVAGAQTEQTFTVYDELDGNTAPRMLSSQYSLNAILSSSGISPINYLQNNLSGNVAATYVSNGESITWYSYDIYGRVEWTVQFVNGAGAKTIHYEYDYKGNVKKVLFQKDKANELFVHQYTYDGNDVLKKVETSTDNSTFITHADYSYYQTGELKRVDIAQGLQGLDYVYTLGGQLKSINHPSLEATKDPGGDANDVFGITLDYYNGDYLRTGRNITSSPSAGADYNGNIRATRWANKGIAADMSGSVANQKGYLYNYDRNNWLTGATFGNTNSSTAAISPTAAYSEGGLSYDPNGNIKTLQRTNDTSSAIDNLTYNYAGKNQLNSVTDAVGAAVASSDIGTQAAGNYSYNAIGQMTRNNQEDIDYFYNTQGLVTQVNKGGNPMVKFYYNERGQRVKKESITYVSSTNIKKSTDYYILDISGNVMAIYNSYSGTTMKPGTNTFTQKDLPIFGLSRLGVYNRASGTSTYEITDHLGNVRAVVQKENGIPVIKSFADYYPFGEQLPWRNSMSNYRYAFQGQEYDKETEMEAFQLRLWDGRIGRWLSPDPMGQYASPYLGMGNNPISLADSDGGEAKPPTDKAFYEGQMHYDSSDNTIYRGNKDGSWTEAAMLNSVYITPEAKGGYINFYSPTYSSNSARWDAMNAGYNYQNGNFSLKPNLKLFTAEISGYKGVASFFVNANASVLDASISAKKYGSDTNNVSGKVQGKFLTVDGDAGAGIFLGEGGKKGLYFGVSGGATAVKGDAVGELTLFGVHAHVTGGVAAGEAEGGIRVGAYHDANSHRFTIEFYERLGLIVGQRAGFKISF